jgi:hypothetical protein
MSTTPNDLRLIDATVLFAQYAMACQIRDGVIYSKEGLAQILMSFNRTPIEIINAVIQENLKPKETQVIKPTLLIN